MAAHKNQNQLYKMQNKFESEEMMQKIGAAEELNRKEKKDARGKRLEYRSKLDAQLNENRNRRDSNIMNRHEMAMNKADLDAYLSGEINYKTMIPGI